MCAAVILYSDKYVQNCNGRIKSHPILFHQTAIISFYCTFNICSNRFTMNTYNIVQSSISNQINLMIASIISKTNFDNNKDLCHFASDL